MATIDVVGEVFHHAGAKNAKDSVVVGVNLRIFGQNGVSVVEFPLRQLEEVDGFRENQMTEVFGLGKAGIGRPFFAVVWLGTTLDVVGNRERDLDWRSWGRRRGWRNHCRGRVII